MADTYTKEELTEIYRGLPEEIKDAMFSPETTDIFDAIKAKQGLTDTQREVMSVYTGFLMMGVLPPEKYVPTLIEKLGIEREKVASIAQEINRDLFNPIKDVLKEVHTAKKSPANTPTRAVSQATPEHTPMSTPSPLPAPTFTLPIPPSATPVGLDTAPQKALTAQQTPVAPITPPSSMNQQGGATQPHVGSIFEQKLGGEFRLKSDAATYSNQGASTGTTPSSANA